MHINGKEIDVNLKVDSIDYYIASKKYENLNDTIKNYIKNLLRKEREEFLDKNSNIVDIDFEKEFGRIARYPLVDGSDNLKEESLKNIWGCEGGCWESPIWVCGLEPGGSGFIDLGEIPESIIERDNKKIQTDEKSFKNWLNEYPFNRYLYHFYGYLLTDKKNFNVDSFVNELKKYFYDDSGNFKNKLICKLNLYPLKRKNHNEWKNLEFFCKGIYLGSPSQYLTLEEYYEFVLPGRRKLFEKLVDRYNPKIIICLGSGEEQSFFDVFGINKNENENGFYRIYNKDTYIKIIDFWRYNSGYKKYCDIANEIKEANIFKDFLKNLNK